LHKITFNSKKSYYSLLREKTAKFLRYTKKSEELKMGIKEKNCDRLEIKRRQVKQNLLLHRAASLLFTFLFVLDFFLFLLSFVLTVR